VEQLVLNSIPLEPVHSLYGVNFRDEDGWRVPANYGDTEAEYRTVREGGAGLIDLSPRGRILVSGSEAVMFLNGLITNDMKTLDERRWMAAVFPTVQGRIIAAVRIFRTADGFLLDTEPRTHQTVLKTIERFTLAGDFRVTDVTNSTVMLTVQGQTAQQIVSTVAAEVGSMNRDAVSETPWRDNKLTAVRATHTAEDGFDFIVPTEDATALWDTLVEAGARPVGYEALETLRIEAGIARFGRDMDETNVVTETNLDDAVSYTKGCYIGQEIIIRIKHRGHVAKKLAGLILNTKTVIKDGTVVQGNNGNEVGRVTSSAFSPTLGNTLALGYLRYEQLTAGTAVRIVHDGQEVLGRVSDLPFVRGSWYSG
jgi:folate-binding protein YgfZ